MDSIVPTVTVLGVDVGGTNTDAAIVEYPSRKVLKSCKVNTTEDFTTGIINAISKVLHGEDFQISSLMLGTTCFLNAVLQCSTELTKVVVVRLCGPTSLGYPPLVNFPAGLKQAIEAESFLVKGGYEYNGREISKVNEPEILDIARQLTKKYKDSDKPLSLMISGIFSPIYPDQETQVENLFLATFKDEGLDKFYITKSSEIAQIGFLEREGASILNAALRNLAEDTLQQLQQCLTYINLNCHVYLTQNDGTLISCNDATRYPIFTFNSGPTNSLRGAYQLTGIETAVVADIGGTSTDVAVLHNGFPRPASSYVDVGGVRTNFRMPDTMSIGLGGGSIVRWNNGECLVGPQSVGFRLKQEALTFGGSHLVTTDIAVKLGNAEITGADPAKADITDSQTAQAQQTITDMLARLVDKIKSNKTPVPLILVGGGSALIPAETLIPGISKLIKPANYDVANAIGATIAQISAVAEHVIDFTDPGSQAELEKLKERAAAKVMFDGAVEGTANVVTDSTHLSYMPGRSMQVKCRAVGSLDVSKFTPWPSRQVQTDSISNQTAKPYIEDVKLKESVETVHELPVPKFVKQNSRQEWIITEDDVHCMAIGAGILGTGGGGSPYIGTLEVIQQLRKGKEIKVIDAEDLQDSEYCLAAFYFGAPLIMTEKLGGAEKIAKACLTMESVMSQRSPELKLAALTPVEIGGCNSLAPLCAGAELGLPIVDNDYMGRAFPHYTMITPIIHGMDATPAVLRDEKGNEIILNDLQNRGNRTHTECLLAEEFLRTAVVVMGCDGGGSGVPIEKKDLLRLGIRRSLSQIWKLGRDILEARKNKTNPLKVIERTQGGRKVFSGKITDVLRVTEGGYNKGNMLIEGFDEFEGKELKIEFQNENLIAYRGEIGTEKEDYEIIATVPDLISLVDVESYQPILTEDLRYGLRVSALVIPAHPLLKDDAGLKVVGPAAFGYKDVVYKPCGEYRQPFSVFSDGL